MQTVLEALGLVENKTASQDAAALKEVCLYFEQQTHTTADVLGTNEQFGI